MMRFAAFVVVLFAGCYSERSQRAEHTALEPNAGAIMVAATASISPGAAKQASFDEHYNAALDFYEKAHYPEAIAEFETAYTFDPQPLLLFNIAQAYRKSEHLEEALAKYREYLAKDPAADRAKVNELIKGVETKLGKGKKVRAVAN